MKYTSDKDALKSTNKFIESDITDNNTAIGDILIPLGNSYNSKYITKEVITLHGDTQNLDDMINNMYSIGYEFVHMNSMIATGSMNVIYHFLIFKLME